MSQCIHQNIFLTIQYFSKLVSLLVIIFKNVDCAYLKSKNELQYIHLWPKETFITQVEKRKKE